MTTQLDHEPPAFGLDRALGAVDATLHTSRVDPLSGGSPFGWSHTGPGLIYLTEGHARVELSRGHCRCVVDMSSGDLIFFPRELWHRTLPYSDGVLATLAFTSGARSNSVVDTLPDRLVVQGFRDREPSIAGLIEGMRCDVAISRRIRPGDSVICNQIAHTILTVAIRAWVEGCATRWSGLVADPHVARAVDAINTDPGRPWTIEDLARIAAMSRTVFAERFRETVGHSPAAYVATIRMEAAMRLLGEGALSVGETARRLGYTSEAGFSRAFRRHVGMTPSVWRRNGTAQQQIGSGVRSTVA